VTSGRKRGGGSPDFLAWRGIVGPTISVQNAVISMWLSGCLFAIAWTGRERGNNELKEMWV